MIKTIKQILETAVVAFNALPLVFDGTSNGNKQFVRFTLEQANSQDTDFGGSARTSRYTGFATASVFINGGAGAGVAYTHAESIANLFRNKSWTVSGVKLEITDIDYSPTFVENNGLVQVNVIIRYRAQKVYTL